MRLIFACLAVLLTSGSAHAFSIEPLPGSSAGLPSFVASGQGASLSAGSPFFGGALPSLANPALPVAPEAYGGGWQFRSGPVLYGTQSFTTTGPLAVRGFSPFSLSAGFVGSQWDVTRSSVGYLLNENLLMYSSVAQARRTSPALTGLPIAPGLTTLEDQRGPVEARAGVQWQAMPGLTLGVEVSGIRGAR